MLPDRIVEIFTSIIQAEIKWCEDNTTPHNQEFQKGFVEGLKQAKLLCSQCDEEVTDQLVTSDVEWNE